MVIGLDIVADHTADLPLSLFATVASLVFGYVSFLLLSYAGYAFGYGLLSRTGPADFVIVLGAGLGRRGAVPPLLASRLDRGRAVWAALDRRAAQAGAPAAADRLRRQGRRRAGRGGGGDGRVPD